MSCVYRLSILLACGLGAVLLVPSLGGVAQAEVRPSDITIPTNVRGLGPGYGRRGIQFQLELGLFTGEDDVSSGKVSRTAVPARLRIVQPVGRNEAEVNLGLVRCFECRGCRGRLSSSTQGLAIRRSSTTMWRTLKRQIRLGLGATAPFTRLRNENFEEQALDYDAVLSQREMTGYKNRWLWSFDSMSVLLQGDYAARFSSGFIVGTNVVVAPMFKVGDSIRSFDETGPATGAPDLSIAIQADLELAYDSEHVRSALGITYSTETASEISDDAKNQLAIVPEFRFRLGDVDLLASLTLPQKSLSGNPFGDGMFWSAMIGIATPTELVLPE